MSALPTFARIVMYTTFLVGLLFANFAAAAGGDIGKCFRSLASCSGESRLVNGTLSSDIPTDLGEGCGSFGSLSGHKLVLGATKDCAQLKVPVLPGLCASGKQTFSGKPFHYVCVAK